MQVVPEHGTSTASGVASPSRSIRMGTSIERAAARKWPEPQQGSRTRNSPRSSGQASNAPAAGRHRASARSCWHTARSAGSRAATPGSAAVRRNSASLAAASRSDALRRLCRPPCPQGVVEQEPHHVGLGKELRHRRRVVRPRSSARSRSPRLSSWTARTGKPIPKSRSHRRPRSASSSASCSNFSRCSRGRVGPRMPDGSGGTPVAASAGRSAWRAPSDPALPPAPAPRTLPA